MGFAEGGGGGGGAGFRVAGERQLLAAVNFVKLNPIALCTQVTQPSCIFIERLLFLWHSDYIRGFALLE